jgi:hypothetical protein
MSQTSREIKRLKRLYSFCGWLCAIWFINFLAFGIGALYLGGDAVNGRIEDGRFYLFGYVYHLGTKGYSEVSQGVFAYSKWHAYSVMTATLICMIAAFVSNKLKARISSLEKTMNVPFKNDPF